jgi:hypothetical protein
MVNLLSQHLTLENFQPKIAMTQIVGDFIVDLPKCEEYLILGFSPSSVPLKQRWRNNGLSADFMADYFTTFFPGDEKGDNGKDTRLHIKSAVSFIANELLENAMKFSDERFNFPVSIELHLEREMMVFVVMNTVHPQQAEQFQVFLEELINSDPADLYIEQLEKNATEESHTESGLGLLTMINDYQAKLGWKFEKLQTDPEAIAVTTMVQLSL